MRKAYVDADGILVGIGGEDVEGIEVADNFRFKPGEVYWNGTEWHGRAVSQLGMDKVAFKAGESFHEHVHKYDQIILLCEGKLEVLGGTFEAPKIIVVRAGIPHAPHAITDCYFLNIRID
jgi:quercetin dioxygenase-like cupin family protein